MTYHEKTSNEAHSDSIRISIATSDEILSWSSGEVMRPETVDADGTPIESGLMCEKIFGAAFDWRCVCGKVRGEAQKNQLCDACDQFPGYARTRRQRMGHIELTSPVVHPLFYNRPSTSPLSVLLDEKSQDIKALVDYRSVLVVKSGKTDASAPELMDRDEFDRAVEEKKVDPSDARYGVHAIHFLLDQLDLEQLASELRCSFRESTSQSYIAGCSNRVRLIEQMLANQIQPESMILSYLPVVSPDYRLVPKRKIQDFGGHHFGGHLTTLYRRIVNRNNRLRKLRELAAPETILLNEERMLQLAVTQLFDNRYTPQPALGEDKTTLWGLFSYVSQRRFRPGTKSVDFSGRSVVAPNSNLRMHQCGLPKQMAMRLYEPFVIQRLLADGHAKTKHYAKLLIQRAASSAWDSLAQEMKRRWVMLSRPVRFAKRGLQAFQPVPVEGKAIQINPQMAECFDAQFNGEQLSVFLPSSDEAQVEAQILATPSNNLVDPTSGAVSMQLRQDALLGLHYLTLQLDGEDGKSPIFASTAEAITAWQNDRLDLQVSIKVRLAGERKWDAIFSRWELPNDVLRNGMVETTIGRILFNELLKDDVAFYNSELTSKNLSPIWEHCCDRLGCARTTQILDRVNRLALRHLTKSGMSISAHDFNLSGDKLKHVDKAEKESSRYDRVYHRGYITQLERERDQLDSWLNAREEILNDCVKTLRDETARTRRPGLIDLSLKTGCMNYFHLHKLAGMTGPFAVASGPVHAIPIKSNYREGLTAAEYYLFFGRTSWRSEDETTKNHRRVAGDIAFRIKRALQDAIVTMEDCESLEGVTKTTSDHTTPRSPGFPYAPRSSRDVPFHQEIVGRVSLHDVLHPVTSDTLVAANDWITEDVAHAIEHAGIRRLPVRSPIKCKSRWGVCQKCYGYDPSTGAPVEVGTAVGTNAALAFLDAFKRTGDDRWQSQIRPRSFAEYDQDRRSFESNCAAGDDVTIKSKRGGLIRFENLHVVDGESSFVTVLNDGGSVQVVDEKNRIVETYRLDRGTKLRVQDGERVQPSQSIAEFSAYVDPIIATQPGLASFEADVEGGIKSLSELAKNNIVDTSDMPFQPRIVLRDTNNKIIESHFLDIGHQICDEIRPQARTAVQVNAGNVLAEAKLDHFPRMANSMSPMKRLHQLLEARYPPGAMLLAPCNGIIESIERYKRITIKPDAGEPLVIRSSRYIRCNEGDTVKAGQPLTDGIPNPFDLLQLHGPQFVAEYLLREIQNVFSECEISFADQHAELVIARMTSRSRIADSGNSRFLPNSIVENRELAEHHIVPAKEGFSPRTTHETGTEDRTFADHPPNAVVAQPLLQGITKASFKHFSFLSQLLSHDVRTCLSEAILMHPYEELRDLTSSEIAGRLIPAGTGWFVDASVKEQQSALVDLLKEFVDNGGGG